MKTVLSLRLRTLAATAAATAGLTLVPGLARPAAAQNSPRFSVVDLGTLRDIPDDGAGDSRAFALNAAGDVTGEAQTQNGALHAFVWRNGVPQDLGTLGGVGSTSAGFGINNFGVVTGVTQDANGLSHAFRFSNNLLQDLGTLGGTTSQGFAINAAGNIAGFAHDTLNRPQAVIFGTSAIQPLGNLGVQRSQAFGINDAGHVVGEARIPGGATVPFFFDGTQMLRMPTLGGTQGRLFGVNNGGLSVGESQLSGQFRAYAVNPVSGAVQDLGTLGGATSRALGIGPHPNLVRVVGTSQTVNNAQFNAFLWEPSRGMQNLNNLIPFNAGWVLQEARAVNDAAMIAGFGINPQGRTRGFLLVPQVLRGFTLRSGDVPGGQSMTATLGISGSASVDLPVDVRFAPGTFHPDVSFPARVVIPRGSRGVTFSITTSVVTAPKVVSLRASLSGIELPANLTVRPISVRSIVVTPNPVRGGASATGRVTLEAPAAPGAISVTVSSANPDLLSVNTSDPDAPLVLTVNAGQSVVEFPITTRPVNANTSVNLSAAANGRGTSTTVRVRTPQVSRLTLAQTSVAGGSEPVDATVFLDGPAQAGGVRVFLGVSQALFAENVDQNGNEILSLVIPQGARTGRFRVATRVTDTTVSVQVNASANGATARANLEMRPARLSSLRLGKNPVAPTESTTLRIGLDGPAAQSLTFTLTSSDGLVTLPGSATIPAGRDSVTVTVRTGFTLISTEVELTATRGSQSRRTFLTVKPF